MKIKLLRIKMKKEKSQSKIKKMEKNLNNFLDKLTKINKNVTKVIE